MSQSFKNYEKCLAYPILNTYNPPHLRDTMSKTTKLKLFWNIKLKYIIQNHTSALLHNCKNGFWKVGSVLVDSCQEYMSPFTQNKFIFLKLEYLAISQLRKMCQIPAGIYLLKVNNRNTKQGVKYVQSEVK